MTGPRSWDLVLREDLVDVECLWQDLDGIHLSTPPREAPFTSIMWAWPTNLDPPGTGPVTFSTPLLRLRLDGATAYVARCHSGRVQSLIPWGQLDQVDQIKRASDTEVDPRNLVLLQVQEALPESGSPPVTFLCRGGAAGARARAR